MNFLRSVVASGEFDRLEFEPMNIRMFTLSSKLVMVRHKIVNIVGSIDSTMI